MQNKELIGFEPSTSCNVDIGPTDELTKQMKIIIQYSVVATSGYSLLLDGVSRIGRPDVAKYH